MLGSYKPSISFETVFENNRQLFETFFERPEVIPEFNKAVALGEVLAGRLERSAIEHFGDERMRSAHFRRLFGNVLKHVAVDVLQYEIGQAGEIPGGIYLKAGARYREAGKRLDLRQVEKPSRDDRRAPADWACRAGAPAHRGVPAEAARGTRCRAADRDG